MRKKIIVCMMLVLLSASSWAEDSGPRDPYEPYNRFMFKINDNLDQHIVIPVAKAYRKVTPSPIRQGVSNFFNNLRDVVSLGSNLLRLDIEKASIDFVRIGINTTFGLGGLIDIADAGDMPNNKNTLGDTFASWGWKNSNYFVYPFLGPSTVRDSIGNTIGSYGIASKHGFFHNDGVRWGLLTLNGIQRRESVLDLTDSLDDVALDRYAYVRDAFMGFRNHQVGGQADTTDDIDIDTLVDPQDDGAQATDDQGVQSEIAQDASNPTTSNDQSNNNSIVLFEKPGDAEQQETELWEIPASAPVAHW